MNILPQIWQSLERDMERRTREALRYLGMKEKEADESLLKQVEETFQELDKISYKKCAFRIFPVIMADGTDDSGKFQIGSLPVHSKNLAKNLKGCSHAAIFVATLGHEVDRRMRQLEVTDMAGALCLQACAAAYLEEYCDEVEQEITEEAIGTRPRFSPGYGDLDIHYQKEILELLDAGKRLGVTLTEGYLLTPLKTVTAFVGILTQ